jgi:hypothetical protein
VGYEINFNRYFYQYQPPRHLEEIEADIKVLEKDILEMLREVAGMSQVLPKGCSANSEKVEALPCL